jgi:hypothetical protein
VIDRIQLDRTLLEKPISELANTRVKLTLGEWARTKLGLGIDEAQHNQRLLSAFVEGVEPLTDEIRLLRARLQEEIVQLFRTDVPWT